MKNVLFITVEGTVVKNVNYWPDYLKKYVVENRWVEESLFIPV